MMKQMHCWLSTGNRAPDNIMPDEPANNLDIHHIETGTMAINDFHETMIIISHGERFPEQVSVKQTIKV
jgi:ATPase subunit of ABC transporter with duplicated ATPase domains